MQKEACVEFVKKAVFHAMFLDAYSGGVCRIGIITEEGIERRVFQAPSTDDSLMTSSEHIVIGTTKCVEKIEEMATSPCEQSITEEGIERRDIAASSTDRDPLTSSEDIVVQGHEMTEIVNWTILSELCHYAMQLLYQNESNPYSELIVRAPHLLAH